MGQYIIARLKETSTWQAILIVISATGATLNPELVKPILTAGAAIIAALGAFLPNNLFVKEAESITQAATDALTKK